MEEYEREQGGKWSPKRFDACICWVFSSVAMGEGVEDKGRKKKKKKKKRGEKEKENEEGLKKSGFGA